MFAAAFLGVAVISVTVLTGCGDEEVAAQDEGIIEEGAEMGEEMGEEFDEEIEEPVEEFIEGEEEQPEGADPDAEGVIVAPAPGADAGEAGAAEQAPVDDEPAGMDNGNQDLRPDEMTGK